MSFQDAKFELRRRPVDVPILERFLDHTYIMGTHPPAGTPNEQHYFFTCFDNASSETRLADDPAIKIDNFNGDAIQNLLYPCIMANTVTFGTNDHNLPRLSRLYNLPTDMSGFRRYAVDGVCHQAANRYLLHTGRRIDFNAVRGGRLSTFLYGLYGRRSQQYFETVVDTFGTVDDEVIAGTRSSASTPRSADEILQALYRKHLENAKSELDRVLIKWGFYGGSEDAQCKSHEEIFYAFMDDSFERRYNGNYTEVDKRVVDELYKHYMQYVAEKINIDNREMKRQSGNTSGMPSKEFREEFDNALRSMLARFHVLLRAMNYKRLFNQNYHQKFTFLADDYFKS